MVAVDTFMNMNNTQGRYMSGMDWNAERNSLKPARFYIPAMTIEDAFDFCGFNEEKEMDRSRAIILPSGGADKLRERQQVQYHMAHHSYSVWVEHECPCDVPYKLHHHPDYSDLDRTWLVCRKCHGKIHSEIDRQNKATLVLMIAVKLFSTRRVFAVVPPSNPSLTAMTDSDRGTLCVTPSLERPTGREEDELTPFEEDSDDSTFQYAIGASCTSFGTRGVQLSLW